MVVLFSFTNFSLCFLSFNKNSPKHNWSSYSITLYDGPKAMFKEAIIFPISLTNSTVRIIHSQIPLLHETIGLILFSKCMHTYLPTSISTKQYSENHTLADFLLLHETIGLILFSKCMHAYLPTSISTWCNDYYSQHIQQHRHMVLMYVHI